MIKHNSNIGRINGFKGTHTLEFQRIDLGNEIPEITVGISSVRTCNSHTTINEQTHGERSTAKK
jgi:hypothetical protein